jgi:hypothetical protein
MKRFLVINTLDEVLNIGIEVNISENGFTKVNNPYIVVNDDEHEQEQSFILLIDTLDKKYCFSNIDGNLVNNYYLSKFEHSEKLDSGSYHPLEDVIYYAYNSVF